MRHQIETTSKDRAAIDKIILEVSCNHRAAEFEHGLMRKSGLVITVHGNGAALRDLVDNLDRAGFLA